MSLMRIRNFKSGSITTIDLDNISIYAYQEAMRIGLEVLLNKRMYKIGSITKLTDKEFERMKHQADAIFAENIERLSQMIRPRMVG
jgi:hypothetical protein